MTRSAGRREEGAAALEFALVLPILLLLVLGIIDFGRAYSAKIKLAGAAREGVRVWATSEDFTRAEAAARNAAPTLESDRVTVPPATACTYGAPTTLSVNYRFSYITPLPAFLSGSSTATSDITLTGTGVMRCSAA